MIEATANAFLHHMVRNIVGPAARCGVGKAPPHWAAEVLASRDRTRSSPTAPAMGLYFWKVRYPQAFGLPEEAAGPVSAIIPGCPEWKVKLMSWFEKIMPSRIKTERRTRSVPEGL